eukprot:Rmarinus@m.1932
MVKPQKLQFPSRPPSHQRLLLECQSALRDPVLEIRIQALDRLHEFSLDEWNKEAVFSSGNLPTIVDLLSSPHCEEQEAACRLLECIASSRMFRESICKSGCVDAIIYLVKDLSQRLENGDISHRSSRGLSSPKLVGASQIPKGLQLKGERRSKSPPARTPSSRGKANVAFGSSSHLSPRRSLSPPPRLPSARKEVSPKKERSLSGSWRVSSGDVAPNSRFDELVLGRIRTDAMHTLAHLSTVSSTAEKVLREPDLLLDAMRNRGRDAAFACAALANLCYEGEHSAHAVVADERFLESLQEVACTGRSAEARAEAARALHALCWPSTMKLVCERRQPGIVASALSLLSWKAASKHSHLSEEEKAQENVLRGRSKVWAAEVLFEASKQPEAIGFLLEFETVSVLSNALRNVNASRTKQDRKRARLDEEDELKDLLLETFMKISSCSEGAVAMCHTSAAATLALVLSGTKVSDAPMARPGSKTKRPHASPTSTRSPMTPSEDRTGRYSSADFRANSREGLRRWSIPWYTGVASAGSASGSALKLMTSPAGPGVSGGSGAPVCSPVKVEGGATVQVTREFYAVTTIISNLTLFPENDSHLHALSVHWRLVGVIRDSGVSFQTRTIAANALGRLAANPEMRIELNAAPPAAVLKLFGLDTGSQSTARGRTWSLDSLMAVHPLVAMLRGASRSASYAAAGALTTLVTGEAEGANALIRAGGVTALLAIMKGSLFGGTEQTGARLRKQKSASTASVRAIVRCQEAAAGCVEQLLRTPSAILPFSDAGGLAGLMWALESGTPFMKLCALRALGHMTAVDPSRRALVAQAGALPHVVAAVQGHLSQPPAANGLSSPFGKKPASQNPFAPLEAVDTSAREKAEGRAVPAAAFVSAGVRCLAYLTAEVSNLALVRKEGAIMPLVEALAGRCHKFSEDEVAVAATPIQDVPSSPSSLTPKTFRRLRLRCASPSSENGDPIANLATATNAGTCTPVRASRCQPSLHTPSSVHSAQSSRSQGVSSWASPPASDDAEGPGFDSSVWREDHDDDDVVDGFAARALCQLALDDVSKEAIYEAGGIPVAVSGLVHGSPTVQYYSGGCLMHLSFLEQNKVVIVDEGGVQPLIQMLLSEPREGGLWQYCLQAICSLSSIDRVRRAVVETGCLDVILQMFNSPTPDLPLPPRIPEEEKGPWAPRAPRAPVVVAANAAMQPLKHAPTSDPPPSRKPSDGLRGAKSARAVLSFSDSDLGKHKGSEGGTRVRRKEPSKTARGSVPSLDANITVALASSATAEFASATMAAAATSGEGEDSVEFDLLASLLEALAYFALDPAGRRKVSRHLSMEKILDIAEKEHEGCRLAAIFLLSGLAGDYRISEDIVASGGVGWCALLLKEGSVAERVRAAALLANLVQKDCPGSEGAGGFMIDEEVAEDLHLTGTTARLAAFCVKRRVLDVARTLLNVTCNPRLRERVDVAVPIEVLLESLSSPSPGCSSAAWEYVRRSFETPGHILISLSADSRIIALVVERMHSEGSADVVLGIKVLRAAWPHPALANALQAASAAAALHHVFASAQSGVYKSGTQQVVRALLWFVWDLCNDAEALNMFGAANLLSKLGEIVFAHGISEVGPPRYGEAENANKALACVCLQSLLKIGDFEEQMLESGIMGRLIGLLGSPSWAEFSAQCATLSPPSPNPLSLSRNIEDALGDTPKQKPRTPGGLSFAAAEPAEPRWAGAWLQVIASLCLLDLVSATSTESEFSEMGGVAAVHHTLLHAVSFEAAAAALLLLGRIADHPSLGSWCGVLEASGRDVFDTRFLPPLLCVLAGVSGGSLAAAANPKGIAVRGADDVTTADDPVPQPVLSPRTTPRDFARRAPMVTLFWSTAEGDLFWEGQRERAGGGVAGGDDRQTLGDCEERETHSLLDFFRDVEADLWWSRVSGERGPLPVRKSSMTPVERSAQSARSCDGLSVECVDRYHWLRERTSPRVITDIALKWLYDTMHRIGEALATAVCKETPVPADDVSHDASRDRDSASAGHSPRTPHSSRSCCAGATGREGEGEAASRKADDLTLLRKAKAAADSLSPLAVSVVGELCWTFAALTKDDLRCCRSVVSITPRRPALEAAAASYARLMAEMDALSARTAPRGTVDEGEAADGVDCGADAVATAAEGSDANDEAGSCQRKEGVLDVGAGRKRAIDGDAGSTQEACKESVGIQGEAKSPPTEDPGATAAGFVADVDDSSQSSHQQGAACDVRSSAGASTSPAGDTLEDALDSGKPAGDEGISGDEPEDGEADPADDERALGDGPEDGERGSADDEGASGGGSVDGKGGPADDAGSCVSACPVSPVSVEDDLPGRPTADSDDNSGCNGDVSDAGTASVNDGVNDVVSDAGVGEGDDKASREGVLPNSSREGVLPQNSVDSLCEETPMQPEVPPLDPWQACGFEVSAMDVQGYVHVVTELFPGYPAEKSGLRLGDVLYRVNGLFAAALTSERLVDHLQTSAVRVIAVFRPEEPDAEEWIEPIFGSPGSFLTLDVPPLGECEHIGLGFESTMMLCTTRHVVARVQPDSPAAAAGFHAGDELVAVHDTPACGRTYAELMDLLLQEMLKSGGDPACGESYSGRSNSDGATKITLKGPKRSIYETASALNGSHPATPVLWTLQALLQVLASEPASISLLDELDLSGGLNAIIDAVDVSDRVLLEYTQHTDTLSQQPTADFSTRTDNLLPRIILRDAVPLLAVSCESERCLRTLQARALEGVKSILTLPQIYDDPFEEEEDEARGSGEGESVADSDAENEATSGVAEMGSIDVGDSVLEVDVCSDRREAHTTEGENSEGEGLDDTLSNSDANSSLSNASKVGEETGENASSGYGTEPENDEDNTQLSSELSPSSADPSDLGDAVAEEATNDDGASNATSISGELCSSPAAGTDHVPPESDVAPALPQARAGVAEVEADGDGGLEIVQWGSGDTDDGSDGPASSRSAQPQPEPSFGGQGEPSSISETSAAISADEEDFPRATIDVGKSVRDLLAQREHARQSASKLTSIATLSTDGVENQDKKDASVSSNTTSPNKLVRQAEGELVSAVHAGGDETYGRDI